MVLKTRDAPLVTVQGAHELTRAGRPHLKRQSWHNFVISSERKSTLMVLSPLAETMYLSSKSTTFTAARCPTNTLLKLISVGLTMSHTWKVESCNLVPMSVYYFRLPLILGFYRNAPVLAAGDHHPVAELGILQKKQSMHNLIYAQRWYLGWYKVIESTNLEVEAEVEDGLTMVDQGVHHLPTLNVPHSHCAVRRTRDDHLVEVVWQKRF